MKGLRGTEVEPSGPLTVISVGEGVSVASAGKTTGARPMCEIWPFLHVEVLKNRLRPGGGRDARLSMRVTV